MRRITLSGNEMRPPAKPKPETDEPKPDTELSDLNVAIIDAGTFIPLADMMGRVANWCGYYSPCEQEYLGIERCSVGTGFKTFQRIDDFLSPEIFDEIDLFLFPDIGFSGLQRDCRRRGKLVWGSMGASDHELFRTQFIKAVRDAGLPLIHSEVITGLTALMAHLKNVKDKWIKIDRYRDNMETWHHMDFAHSQREFERLAKEFGPLKDEQKFVVQDAIEEEPGKPVLEIGYDGWMITSPKGVPQFPARSYQGYEAKNELYLGSALDSPKLPKEVRLINEKFAPTLARYGYRNFWATEIRVKDGVPYFIDPTPRMAGQTMEHLLETCSNLPEVILAGARGEIIKPNFINDYSSEATLHYKSNGNGCEWKTIVLPEKAAKWFKLYRCCRRGNEYHFPPHKSDELGVVIGNGETIEAAVENMTEHFNEVKNEPMYFDPARFSDLIKQIEKAEGEGLEFSDQPLPDPHVAMDAAE